MLPDLVTVRADTEMARRRLPLTDSGGWEICHDEGRLADEVVGRIETVSPFGPMTLVVDGHAISWDELGQAFSPYEGWQFVAYVDGRSTWRWEATTSSSTCSRYRLPQPVDHVYAAGI
jgi:hypothetical protein